MPPDPPAWRPSAFCDAAGPPVDVAGLHTCTTDGTLDTSLPVDRGGDRDTDMGLDEIAADRGNASEGFGTGMALLPYVLDWGDVSPKPRRSRFLLTILKTYPRREDRRLAFTYIAHFVSPLDTCNPPITLHLLLHAPFAGYAWDVRRLKLWLDQVQRGDCHDPPRTAVDPVDAVPLATDWLTVASQLWPYYTAEPFPYSLLDLLPFWTLDLSGADLSEPAPDGPLFVG